MNFRIVPALIGFAKIDVAIKSPYPQFYKSFRRLYHNFVANTTDLSFFVKYDIIYRLKGRKRGGFMIKGAVFDMDGLMIDSERLVYSIWQEMMDEDGREFNLDIFKKSIGLRSEDSYEYYKSVYGDDFDYPAYKAESRIRYFKRIEKNGVPVKKGLYEIFDYLKSISCKISLATSTSSQTALALMKKINLYDKFDAFVCGDDVKNGKPNPEVFLTAADKLGLDPKDCVAFEDSINGIKSAHAAGMTTVMVPDLLEPTDEIKPMIDFLCEDLGKAINCLAN